MRKASTAVGLASASGAVADETATATDNAEDAGPTSAINVSVREKSVHISMDSKTRGGNSPTAAPTVQMVS